MSPALRKALGEFRRGLAVARHGGLNAGWAFFREEGISNTLLRLAPSAREGSARARVECNLCGWRGPRFLTHCGVDYIDRNAFCPSCRSYARHRGFGWVLEHQLADELARLERAPGKRLVFAPEPGLLRLFTTHLSRLEGVDLHPINEHVTHIEDKQALSFADESIAFISSFHVLEHVPDDRRALSELRRVLHPEGRLALCVPITFGRPETIDFGGPNPRMNDHCFDYGEDFTERLLEAGFSGRAYQLAEVVPQEVRASLGTVQELVFWLRRTPSGTPRIDG